MKELNLTLGQDYVGFNRGTFMWDDESLDFKAVTLLGCKPPMKSKKWQVLIESEDITIGATCSYEMARIVNTLANKIEGLNDIVLDLRSE